jgi:hypothetical protein
VGEDRLAGPGLHNRGDIVVAEPQVLTDERARDDAGGGFGLEPGFAHPEYSGCFCRSVELTCHCHHT